MVPVMPQRPPKDPENGLQRLTLQPHEMRAALTSSKDVFVLAHLGVPRVDPGRWALLVDGLLRRPFTLGLEDLRAQPKRVVEAVHQCCGSPMRPKEPTRRVANLRWGGTDLRTLLDAHGIDARAQFLWSFGLDGGTFAGEACDWYVKDMPLARLAAGDVLIAYELNGEPLSAEHGFPARLVVPGYYATNSVKWLWRLHLADRRADGLFAARFYNDAADALEVAAGAPPHRPVWAIAPEAVIVSPSPGTVVDAGEPVEVTGWAWSFRGVEAVEISTDGGDSFVRARLAPRRDWGWQGFALPWRPRTRGEVDLSARAIEMGGASQPRGGARNAMHTVRVVVA